MNSISQEGMQSEDSTRRRRCVSINEVPTEIITSTEHNTRYAPLNKGKKWYTSTERKRVEREIKATVDAYNVARRKSVSFEENERLCLRGLEDRLSTGAMLSRKSQKFHYVRGVLREQARRRREGILEGTVITEPELDATSKWAMKNALEMAERDAVDAYEASPEISEPPIVETTRLEEHYTRLSRSDRKTLTLMPPCC